MKEKLPVALITGVGPGTGAAIARRFARGGYAVAMLARNSERLSALEREIEHSRGYLCDVTDEARPASFLWPVSRWLTPGFQVRRAPSSHEHSLRSLLR